MRVESLPSRSTKVLNTTIFRPSLPSGGTFFSTPIKGVVYIVDDDPGVREGVGELLDSHQIGNIPCESAADFLRRVRTDTTSCVMLDVRLPDMNGLDLQRQLGNETAPPIIFFSGYADVPSTVRAMKAGAVEFLTKPVDPERLLPAIWSAFAVDVERRQKSAELKEIQERFGPLSPREREVLPLIVGGMLNKQAAAHLGITEVTLQVHRGQIMRKTKADSFADLVRMALRLGIPETEGAL